MTPGEQARVKDLEAENARLREALEGFPSMALSCDLKCEACWCGYREWDAKVQAALKKSEDATKEGKDA